MVDLGPLIFGVCHIHAPPKVILSFLALFGRIAEPDATVLVDPLPSPGVRYLVPGLPKNDLLDLPLLFDCQVTVDLGVFGYEGCRSRDHRRGRRGGQGETKEKDEENFLHYELSK